MSGQKQEKKERTRFEVRCKENELREIKRKAHEAGYDLSTFVRNAALEAIIKPRIPAEVLHVLGGFGQSLKQLALNSKIEGVTLSDEVVEILHRDAQEIVLAIAKIWEI